MKPKPNDIAGALYGTLSSPNVPDSNGEQANIVDVLDQLGLTPKLVRFKGGAGDSISPLKEKS
jgi:hypothetical protein